MGWGWGWGWGFITISYQGMGNVLCASLSCYMHALYFSTRTKQYCVIRVVDGEKYNQTKYIYHISKKNDDDDDDDDDDEPRGGIQRVQYHQTDLPQYGTVLLHTYGMHTFQ